MDEDAAERVRGRLESAGAEVEETPDGWRARLGGGVAELVGGELVLRGNRERLERALEGGGRATVRFDGASRGNPGEAAAAWLVEDRAGEVTSGAERIGEATNNEAEYAALLHGLLEARELGFHEVEAVGDSELVVRQVAGDWRCRADNLRPLLDEVQRLAGEFESFEIRHVPREVNERTDELANEALDAG